MAMLAGLGAAGGAAGGLGGAGGLLSSIFSMQDANRGAEEVDPRTKSKRNMIGSIAGLGMTAANNTNKSMDAIGNAVMDVLASRSENPYPHAMNIRAKARGRQDILDENQARRNQQAMLQGNQIAANQAASAEDRGWRSGEADKARSATAALQQAAQAFTGGQNEASRLFTGQQNDAQRQAQHELFGLQQGAYDARDQRNFNQQLAAEARKYETGLRGMLVGQGVDPNGYGPRSATGLESLAAQANQQNIQKTLMQKRLMQEQEQEMFRAKLADLIARTQAKKVEADWMKGQIGGDGGAGQPMFNIPGVRQLR